jgi:hypothetical protein
VFSSKIIQAPKANALIKKTRGQAKKWKLVSQPRRSEKLTLLRRRRRLLRLLSHIVTIICYYVEKSLYYKWLQYLGLLCSIVKVIINTCSTTICTKTAEKQKKNPIFFYFLVIPISILPVTAAIE